MNEEEQKKLLEGRDIVLYYLIKSLEEFYAINPQLVANGFVKLLNKYMPEYSERYVGQEIDPSSFNGEEDFVKARDLIAKACCVDRKIQGHPNLPKFDMSNPKSIVVYDIENCTYKDLAKLSVEDGKKGCIFCPVAFANMGGIAASVGVNIKSIDTEFDMDTELCKVTINWQ